MDAIDWAQEREAELRAEALYAAQRQPVETAHIVDGRCLCLDCEDPIDRRRLKANPQAVRCADCQQQFEYNQKRARGR